MTLWRCDTHGLIGPAVFPCCINARVAAASDRPASGPTPTPICQCGHEHFWYPGMVGSCKEKRTGGAGCLCLIFRPVPPSSSLGAATATVQVQEQQELMGSTEKNQSQEPLPKEESPMPDATEIDTTNEWAVRLHGDRIGFGIRSQSIISKAEALVFAAYLVTLADEGDGRWERTLAAVQNT